jgi:DNA-binding NarL/FixJ family response regulator
MKIIIVDDNPDYREGLRYFLSQSGEYDIIAEYGDGEEILNEEKFYFADIILMDIMMPKVDGYKAAKLLIQERAELKLIAITMFQDQAYLLDLIQTGFKACIYKLNIYNELPLAIQTVMDGKPYFPEEILLKNTDAGVARIFF